MGTKILALVILCVGLTSANPSAQDVLVDMYHGCLKDFTTSCVKPKALEWISLVSQDDVIRITEDLEVVKDGEVPQEESRGVKDIYDSFEDFLATHRLVAKVPSPLRVGGVLSSLVPRSFVQDDVNVPLAVTGRSKFVKKVMIPFLLGLKFKTAVLVPLALALIALKTWKAMTLGLLSLVLTGAMVIFKFTKPKVVNYEVVHYPHHHHHVEHIEHPPVAWEPHHGWEPHHAARSMNEQQMAYNAYQP